MCTEEQDKYGIKVNNYANNNASNNYYYYYYLRRTIEWALESKGKIEGKGR